jgi:16S rRNA (cytidine1402-2'-O)-methyltransferase
MEKVVHIIPTPIGNLEDITLRAIRLLKESDIVLVEDSRVTRKLFSHYQIKNKLINYHAFNEHKKLKTIINKINNGVKVSLVSDAGTPGISDPGFLLIRECIKHNIRVSCLPGPTACISALIQSGLPCDKFKFQGFLPTKKGRKKLLDEIVCCKYTNIIYEAPHRILKTLENLHELCPQRKVVVLKELTKLHESCYRGSVDDVIEAVSKSKIKGEFVIILDGKK